MVKTTLKINLWQSTNDCVKLFTDYDSQLSEFIGCILLYNLNSIIDPSNHGLYRDDAVVIGDNCTPRKADTIRKKFHLLFSKFGLSWIYKLIIKIRII